MSFPNRLLSPLALVVLVCAAGCATGRLVVPITLDASTLARPARVQDFTSHEATVRGIAGILTTTLGLPVPEHVTVYVYSSRSVFEQGLVNDATDYLIARAGFDRVVAYFSAFTASDRERAFHDAFGQSRDDFEREVLDHLSLAGR